MRNSFMVLLQICVLIVFLYAEQENEIRVATQPIPQFAPVFVAEKKGWIKDELEKYNTTVRFTSFQAGPPMNESFAAGQQDIGFLGDTPAIIAKSSGQDNVIIASTSNGPKAFALIVKKDSPLKSPKELKGKKIAVVKGSYAHHLLVLILKSNNLSTSDVQIINMAQADINIALSKADIDAGVVWEPLITKLESDGIARVLTDGTGLKKGLLVIVARNKFAKSNQEIVGAFLKAYKRGADYIKSNPTEAASLIADNVRLSSDQLLSVFGKINYDTQINEDDINELKTTVKFMKSENLIRTEVNIGSFVDISYLKLAGIQ